MFSKIYSANELGISKKDPGSYEYIAEDLGVKTDEIFFTDDTATNIEAAKSAGVLTRLYLSNDDLIGFLKKL